MSHKRWLVVGPRPIDGHPPGTEFQADYPPEHAAFLTAAGHIQPVRPAKKKPTSRRSVTDGEIRYQERVVSDQLG